MSRVGSVAATIGLGIAGVVGLFMSLCGGLFSGMALARLHDVWSGAFLVISLPSLLVGGVILWLVVRAVRRRRARRAAAGVATILPEPTDDEPAAK